MSNTNSSPADYEISFEGQFSDESCSHHGQPFYRWVYHLSRGQGYVSDSRKKNDPGSDASRDYRPVYATIIASMTDYNETTDTWGGRIGFTVFKSGPSDHRNSNSHSGAFYTQAEAESHLKQFMSRWTVKSPIVA